MRDGIAIAWRVTFPREMEVEFQWGRWQAPVAPEAVADLSEKEARDYNSGVVAYLQFSFLPVSPYTVKKPLDYTDHQGKQRSLRVGSAWMRYGASKGPELRPEQHYLLVSHQDIPYVDNSGWNAYATSQPRHPSPEFHQPITGWSDRSATDGFDWLVHWLNEHRYPVLYLHSGAGSGKSTLLRLLNDHLLDQLKDWTKRAQRHEATPLWIPILVEVTGEHFGTPEVVVDHLLHRLNLYGDLSSTFDLRPGDLEWRRRLFESPDYRFVVIVDGLDEMDRLEERCWTESMVSICHCVESHGLHMRSIVSARTGTLPTMSLRPGWMKFQLLPLDRERVEAGIMLLEQPSERQAIFHLLTRSPELHDLMVHPLALDAALSYVQRSSRDQVGQLNLSFRLGEILDHIVTAMLAHEAAKDLSPSRDWVRIQRREALAKLAWNIDGGRDRVPISFVERHLGTAEEVQRVLQMGILTYTRDGQVEFRAMILKAYFAARHALTINNLPEVGDIEAHWASELMHAKPRLGFWTMCESILSSLLEDDEDFASLAPFYRYVQRCAIENT